ncbi:MAG: hypothetical protein LWW94_08895 [Candidatus Desulfofervidaceae bacterium]|nr:hypothetical protein [Candidatus Desulfofervidaceae bacterium]
MKKIIPFPKVKKNNSEKDWEILIITSVEYEAYLIYGLLKVRHIPCYLECLKHTPHPVTAGQLGHYIIWVPSVWLKIAQRVIRHG